MELWFLVKNRYRSKPSLIRVVKSTVIKVIPVIMNEDINLDEIQFSGHESNKTIYLYLTHYFKNVKEIKSYEEGKLILNIGENPIKENRLKACLWNIFFPGLGFYFFGYPISGTIIFIATTSLLLSEEIVAWLIYSLVLLLSLTIKD